MASLSFRDRFFSPPVGRALTSPSGILALGAGAAVGVLATVATGGVAAIVAGGVIGGLVGYGGRVALALPKKGRGPVIDPFAIDEPWRHAVRDAIHARTRFSEAVRSFRDGPLRESLASIADQIDTAVEECWNVAQGGQRLAEARKQIDDREVRWELQQAAGQIPPGGAATSLQAATVESLNAQLASAARMDDLMRTTFDELKLLNARLDQAVTQAIELSVAERPAGVGPVGSDIEAIVDRLTAMDRAMHDLDALSPTSPSAIGEAEASGAAPAPTEPDPSDPQRPQTFPPTPPS